MPRYGFEMENGPCWPDHARVELVDQEAAHQYGIGLAEAVLQQHGDGQQPCRVMIKDDRGEMLAMLHSIRC